MYLNTVHGAKFDYFFTFLGDVALCSIISASITNHFGGKK